MRVDRLADRSESTFERGDRPSGASRRRRLVERAKRKERWGRRTYRRRTRALKGKRGLEGVARLERRVDRVLHRAGLANSVQQARQRVAAGAIERLEGERWCVVKAAGRCRKVGEVRRVEPTVYEGHVKVLRTQWERWPTTGVDEVDGDEREVDAFGFEELGRLEDEAEEAEEQAGRSVPEYLEVDWETGRVCYVEPITAQRLVRPGKTLAWQGLRPWRRRG